METGVWGKKKGRVVGCTKEEQRKQFFFWQEET